MKLEQGNIDKRPDNNTALTALKSILERSRRRHHRHLVVFSGQQALVKSALLKSLAQLETMQTLFVTEESSWCAEVTAPEAVLKSSEVKRCLGSTIDSLIWDGFSSLHPDGLGAATGLIKGGGLMFLLLPELQTVSQTPDPDYHRMCASEQEFISCGTRFLQRLVNLVKADTDVAVFSELMLRQLKQLPLTPIDTPAPKASRACHPTQDQLAAIEAIIKVAKGHRKRPLVIQADRGRGKSSALGMAASRLCLDFQMDVIITAPSQRACDAAFQHFNEIHRNNLPSNTCSTATLIFYAPDLLLATKPPCHILLVDEAAAIPAPLLAELLMHYPRIVFSSTIHGYEGTGQGFAVRFRKTLDTQTPHWKSLVMCQPVRWADHDPLENWISNLLLLDADFAEPPAPDQQDLSALPVTWIKQSDLISHETILRQIVGLLVLAHYQTSPSDIRLILDHPAIHLGVIESKDRVLAAVLLIKEGGICEPEIARSIINGERRPRGQLVPQLLASSTGMADLLARQTFRVMRITVHPSLFNRGLGSRLIEASTEHAQQHNIDYLSASFGFTSELMAFWSKNHCQLLRIGYHKDAASGTPSAVVAKAVSSDMHTPLQQCQHAFREHFISGLGTLYRTLDWQLVDQALLALDLEPAKPGSLDHILANGFAYHRRSLEDSALALTKVVLNDYAKRYMEPLSADQRQLIIMRLLQGRSWKTCVAATGQQGKKQAGQMLRKAIMKILESR